MAGCVSSRRAGTASSSTRPSPVELRYRESQVTPSHLGRWPASSSKPAGRTEPGGDMKRYAIVVEDAGSNWAAYVPDLPGCVATADTVEEVGQLIREAIRLHLEGLAEDGLPVPEPSSRVEYVEVNA